MTARSELISYSFDPGIPLWHINLYTESGVERACIPGGGGGGGGGGLFFAGFVPLASQSPCHIIVYSVANYRPHLSHFRANM